MTTVLFTALAVAVLAFLGLRWWAGQGHPLPATSFTVAAVFALLGGAEFLVARRIRHGVAGTSKQRLDPLWSHRMLLIGQAAALTGGVVLGWYLALGAVALPDIDAASVRRVVTAALALAAGGFVLAAGGFAIQSACRIDPPDAAEEDWSDGKDAWGDPRRLPDG